jgi:hypothetical protein
MKGLSGSRAVDLSRASGREMEETISSEEDNVKFESESWEHICAAVNLMQRPVY